jgi:hypothetical protein
VLTVSEEGRHYSDELYPDGPPEKGWGQVSELKALQNISLSLNLRGATRPDQMKLLTFLHQGEERIEVERVGVLVNRIRVMK